MHKKWLSLLLAVLFLSSIATVPRVGASPGTELVLAVGKWKTLNPLTSSTVYSNVILGKVYEPLIRWDKSGTKVVGALAEKWEFKKEGDNKVLTFHLRKGVKWHDGKDVTAEDVKFTIELFKSDPSKFVNPDTLIINGLQEIKVVDKYTVQLLYNQSAAADKFLEMAFTTLYIVPKHVWEDKSVIPDSTASLDKPDQLVGCGPFKVVEVKPGEYVKIQAFKDYYLGKPEVDTAIFKVLTDKNQFAMMVANGELDAGYFYFFGKYLEEFENMVSSDPNVKIYRAASKSTHLLAFNFKKSPYNNLEFRKAIAYALPVDKIVQKYYGTDGAKAGSMGFLGPFFGEYAEYMPKEKLYPYDPDKAKEILDDLGFKDVNGDGYRETPDGKPFEIHLLTRAPGDSFFRDAIGDEIANYLKDVGIKVDVDKAGDYWDKWGAGSWDMAIVGFVPHKPTDLIWFTSDNPGNRVGFSDKTYDEIFEEFQRTGDPALAHKLEEILANNVVFIALYHPIVATPYRVDRYKDWAPNPRFLTLGYWSFLGTPEKPTPTTTTSPTTSPSSSTSKPSASSTTSSSKTPIPTTSGSEGEKGICGPAVLVLLAVLPLLKRRR